MMAATLAQGTTILQNCAQEPEVVDVSALLCKMGALIEGAGSPNITIQGVFRLHGGISHTIIPDRIEAGTYMMAALATKGNLTLHNVKKSHLTSVIQVLEKCGGQISTVVASDGSSLQIGAKKRLKSVQYLETGTYPQFPTDLQAPFCTLMSIARGKSVIKETIFENRFIHLPELEKMGAKVSIIEENTVAITGRQFLQGGFVQAHDLRGAAALVIAGLAAKDSITVISGATHHLNRGYSDFVHKLRSCSARIVEEAGKCKQNILKSHI